MPLWRRGPPAGDETRSVSADISDAYVEGSVIVGDHNVQYVAGGDIVLGQLSERPVVALRDRPVRHLPRDFETPLGRAAEIRQAHERLEQGEMVELVGPSGIGKTALLRHLAHRVGGDAARDGVLHTYCGQQPPADLLQWLFESFVTTNVNVKATAAQLDEFLRERRAIVVLDDVGIDREALGEVTDRAPECTFLWAAQRRLLWGEGASLALADLGDTEALELFRREAGEALSPADLATARTLCHAVGGQPSRVLQAAALLRAPHGVSSSDLAGVAGPAAFDELRERGLEDEERQLAGLLAAFLGATLQPADMAVIAQVDDPTTALGTLVDQGIAQAHSPRYSLIGEPGPVLSAPSAVGRFLDRALERFAMRTPPADGAAADLPAILIVLEHGVASRRWTDVMAVVRSEERRAALAGRWDAWKLILEYGRRAARELGDARAAAWIDHQLGVRGLCLGELGAAELLLGGAVAARRALGDDAGAARTERTLRRGLGPHGPTVPPRRWWSTRSGAPVLAAVAAGVAGVVTGVAVGGMGDDAKRTAAATKTVTGTDRRVTVTKVVPGPIHNHNVTHTVTVTHSGRVIDPRIKTVTATKTETVTETETETVTETVTNTVTVPQGRTKTQTVTVTVTKTVTVPAPSNGVG
jgi:hypothetical protein